MDKTVSLHTLQRMPQYLSYLISLPDKDDGYISAKAIGEALSLGEIQVRKDLAAVSDGGKPKVGYRICDLIGDMESFLGYDDVNDAVLVGAGKLGRALMGYRGFEKYGLNIVAAFDTNPSALGKDESGKPVFPMEKLGSLCRRMNVRIGIITVPADADQKVCDMMISAGIKAVWNFSPTILRTPAGVLVENENLASSLAILSRHLRETIGE